MEEDRADNGQIGETEHVDLAELVLGRYIGRLLSRAATIDRESAKRTDSGEAEREWVDEPQLTGS